MGLESSPPLPLGEGTRVHTRKIVSQSMPPKHPIETALAEVWPPEAWRDVTVLVAVSGGPDSVALLRAIVTLKEGGRGGLCVAHFNHQLRGAESGEDEA